MKIRFALPHALALVASLVLTAASAQVPSAPLQPGQNPVLPSAQVFNATAGPTPTPPPNIVGQNLDPVPAETPASAPPVVAAPAPVDALPAGFPAAPQRNSGGRPREEKFIPSEIITALPPVAKSSEIRAVLRTSVGDITLKLDRANAPLTVAQFIGLARGDKEFIDVKTSKPVKRPFYNGLTFHRAVKGTLIQTGDPFGNGRGGPGAIAQVPDELKPTMKFNRPGLVAMAPMRDDTGKNTVKNTNGSQFFITLREMKDWDGQYTIFAEVEDGLEVVQKIANSKVGPTERPIKRIYLIAVEIIESN